MSYCDEKMDFRILLLVVIGVLPVDSRSSNEYPTNKGKVFYLTLLEHLDPGSTIELHIVTDHPYGAVVKVSAPLSTHIQPHVNVLVNYGESTKVSLNEDLILSSTKQTDLGIYVESDQMISVQVMSQSVKNLNNHPDSVGGYLAFPYPALGTRYVAVTYLEKQSCYIGMVATQDGTIITLVFKSPVIILTAVGDVVTESYYNNGVMARTMNQHQTFQIQSKLDLTGTEIVSNYPVAVFVSSDHTTVKGAPGRDGDYMTEQLPPIEALGKVHVLIQMPQRTERNLIRVVASNDLTQFNVDGTVYTLAMAGNYKDVTNVSSEAVLRSTKPVLVAQICRTYSVNNEDSDPNLVIVAPVRQWTGSYKFTTPITKHSISETFYVVLVAATACMDGIKLDGWPVVLNDWTDIPNTKFSFYKGWVIGGYHQVDNRENCAQVWGYIYGKAHHQSWALPIGWGFRLRLDQTPASEHVFSLDTVSAVHELAVKSGSLDVPIVQSSSSWNVPIVTSALVSENFDLILKTSELKKETSSQDLYWDLIIPTSSYTVESSSFGDAFAVERSGSVSVPISISAFVSETNDLRLKPSDLKKETSSQNLYSDLIILTSSYTNTGVNMENIQSSIMGPESESLTSVQDIISTSTLLLPPVINITPTTNPDLDTFLSMSPIESLRDEQPSSNSLVFTSAEKCSCSCPLLTATEQDRIRQVEKYLFVDKRTLSSSIRKKISVPDERPSAQAIGLVGIVTVISVILWFILPDFLTVFRYVCLQRISNLKCIK